MKKILLLLLLLRAYPLPAQYGGLSLGADKQGMQFGAIIGYEHNIVAEFNFNDHPGNYAAQSEKSMSVGVKFGYTYRAGQFFFTALAGPGYFQNKVQSVLIKTDWVYKKSYPLTGLLRISWQPVSWGEGYSPKLFIEGTANKQVSAVNVGVRWEF